MVQVVLKGAKVRQSELAAALMPVAQRPLITYTQVCHAFDANDEGGVRGPVEQGTGISQPDIKAMAFQLDEL